MMVSIISFQKKLNFNGFIMFQETHSSLNDEKPWKDEFDGPLMFLTRQKVLSI